MHLFERQQQAMLAKKNSLFSSYMRQLETTHTHNIFASCTAWQTGSSLDLKLLVNQGEYDRQAGGYFLRYNDFGICINPGPDFLKRLFALGFHLWHIDCVINTSPADSSSFEIELIHSLARQINLQLVENEQEPHVIRYLLHPETYAKKQAKLRPHFREERQAVSCLEPFEEGDERQLSDHVLFSYAAHEQSLLSRFTLPNGVTLGYTSGVWSSAFSSFFQSTDILVCPYSEELTRSVPESCRLLFLSEFSLSEADIRLEAAKEIKTHRPALSILPLEESVVLDLDEMTITAQECLQEPTSATHVRVIRLHDFEKMIYTSDEHTL